MKLKLTSCVGFKDFFTGQKALLVFHRRDVDDVDDADDVDDTNDAQLSTEDFFTNFRPGGGKEKSGETENSFI